jgi:hypothetical protein
MVMSTHAATARSGHHGHAYCGTRFCVPHFLHEQLDQQLGGSEMLDLFAWYPRLDACTVGAIADPLDYVRDAFKQALRGRLRHGGPRSITTGWTASAALLERCTHLPHCLSSRACQLLLDLEQAKKEGT